VKTDTIFYSLFKGFPSIFFELINQPKEQAETYEFTSREIKQLAFRLDGLFFPKDETREQPLQFRELFTRVQRIYLDELGDDASDSLGVNIVKLVIENEQTAPERARRLIEQAQVQLVDQKTQRGLIDLIETIIVYKLPQKSRKEIEAMLGLSELKQTKVYQEAKQEGLQEGRQEGLQEGLQEGRQEGLQEGLQEGKQKGQLKAKLEAIPRMMQLGLSWEMIAEGLDLPGQVVQQAMQSFSGQNVLAFIELLQEQRELFSAQDLVDFAELIKALPDQVEDLSNAIAQWCKQDGHSPQRQAWRDVVSGKVAATVEEGLATNLASLETVESSVNKATLQQAIEHW